MSVELTKTEVLEKNKIAIKVCDQSIDRLNNLIDGGLLSADGNKALKQKNRAQGEKELLQTVNAHLRAAGTKVSPMNQSTVDELNDLGNKLDEKIRNNLIINATIDFITSALNDAKKLREIVEAHQG